MKVDFDYVIVGSGFGGSISAYNLSRAGYGVCVIERGGEWPRGSFPRGGRRLPHLFWEPGRGNVGPIDYRSYDGLDVLVSSGVGGGSLLYSGFLIEAPDRTFERWPFGITHATLAPYYARVKDFLDVKRYPFAERLPYSDTNRIRVLQKGVDLTGRGKLGVTDLGIQFMNSPSEWGTSFVNKHGAVQTGCVMCAECNVGCQYHAKSSMDVNYLFRARAQGAVVRARHQVDRIEPSDGGYRVACTDTSDGEPREVTITARRVILSAGCLGSTELLLRNRDLHGTLPNVSERLGHGFSGNGNSIALLTGLSDDPVPLEPYRGPTLVVGIKYDDFFIEDTGIADFVTWLLDGIIPGSFATKARVAAELGLDALANFTGIRPAFGIIKELADLVKSQRFVSRSTYVISIGHDRSNGVVSLDDEGKLAIDWSEDKEYFKRVRKEVHGLASALDGSVLYGKSFSFHLLGGCGLGERPEEGVVDGNGEVWGHPGLYVIDGAVMPTGIGVNPALTISAMSEMLSERLAKGGFE